jgi:uncharacterized protein (DUF362 family)
MTRREFLRTSAHLVAVSPLLPGAVASAAAAGQRFDTRVAIARCPDYQPATVRAAYARCFDLLGGIGPLVRNKTVTVKINLTGTDFRPIAGRPAHETAMTHYQTAAALAALLFDAGARRVRFVESTNSRWGLETSLGFAEWDVAELRALGRVEFENTRNRGSYPDYARLPVPGGGYLFTHLELNRAYVDTDVMVSLCKLKQHTRTGITLALKNMFGITPNALYGEQAGREDATKGRLNLHDMRRYSHLDIPGLKRDVPWLEATTRVPRIITDLCAARPIDLAIIDGITTMTGGEGWWCAVEGEELGFVQPGVLIAGFNPVTTDAVGTAVMGFDNPRAPRGEGAFKFCDNMLLLAEEAGLGTADLGRIDVRGLTIAQARHAFPELLAARRAVSTPPSATRPAEPVAPVSAGPGS